MMASSHVPFAAICWLGYATYTNQPVTIPQLLVASFAGLLPDIDSPSSTIGRRIRPISKFIGSVVGHRGFTHSLIFSYILVISLMYITANFAGENAGLLYMYIPPLIVGYLSHILGDMFTPSGVPLLWPWKFKFKLPYTFKADSKTETIFVSWLVIFSFTAYINFVFLEENPIQNVDLTNPDSVITYVSVLWDTPTTIEPNMIEAK